MEERILLIVDSGSTKTDWCVLKNGAIAQRIETLGINPFFQSREEIDEVFSHTLLPQLLTTSFYAIHYYGAGCTHSEHTDFLKKIFSQYLTIEDTIHVASDLLAVAHATCGKEAGVACILGTGSNSCFYDGAEICAQVSPLGYILGDEGSGAYLGKRLIGDLLKNQMPIALKEQFLSTYQLQPIEILERVYKRPFPNRFLAHFSPFIKEHIAEPCMRALVVDSFREFFSRNLLQYPIDQYPVHFVGSVAYHYKELLQEVCAEYRATIGKIEKSPMNGLIQYNTIKTSQ